MVVDGPQVDAVAARRRRRGAGAREGTLFVDMSHDRARGARARSAPRCAERGLRFVDAPVTGSSPKAEDGTLTIMAGGAADDVDAARPLFEAMGEIDRPRRRPVGQGQMVKLINNAVAAANAVTLGAGAARRPRRPASTSTRSSQVMGAGSGGSTMLDLKAGPMREHDYTTLFKLEHMLKDVRHCLEEAQAAGVPFPAAAAARRGAERRRWAAATATTTSRRSSRSWRDSPDEGCRRTAQNAVDADSCEIRRRFWISRLLCLDPGQSRRLGPRRGGAGISCCHNR